MAAALASGEAPPRAPGRHSGYVGKGEITLAESRMRRSLARLARDPQPDARRLGVELASEIVAAMMSAAARADAASSFARRQAEAAERLGRRIDAAAQRVNRRTTTADLPQQSVAGQQKQRETT